MIAGLWAMPPTPPSVCAVLLTYDCESFVEEALVGVLDQRCDPLGVLVSDDASRDGTLDVVERLLARYRGPHRVRVFRRSVNSGSKSAHLNALVDQLEGEVIVLFDGDDVSAPQRVRRLVEVFGSDPRVQAVYSAISTMDRDGRKLGPAPVPRPPAGVSPAAWFARADSYAPGGTLALRRDVFERFEPIDEDIHEDVVLPFRASLLGEVRYLPEPLVTVRRHAASFTADPGRYRSVDALRARMTAGIERAARSAQGRLRDLATIERGAPERAPELAELRAVVDDSLRQAEGTRDLLSPWFWRRWRALLRIVRARAYPDQLAEHTMLALSPALYVCLKRWRAARRIR